MRREHFKSDLFRSFHHYTNRGASLLHGPRSHQNPQPVTYRKSITVLRINQIVWLTEAFPPKASPFQQKLNFLMCYLFPCLANAGELQLCVAMSDRLHFLLSKRWTALCQDQIYSQSGCVPFFFLPLQTASENA